MAVSLNSRLESNKEAEEKDPNQRCQSFRGGLVFKAQTERESEREAGTVPD